MKIYIKEITEGCMPKTIHVGDWIDLVAAEDIEYPAPQAGVQYTQNGDKFRDVCTVPCYVKLGVAMKIPEGYEAILAPRSSSAMKFSFIQANSIGVIDNTYCGDNDEWMLPIVPINNVSIKKGDRICQFRIQLSQKATFKQKFKWLFDNKIELVKVNNLKYPSRGGFGSTGVN